MVRTSGCRLRALQAADSARLREKEAEAKGEAKAEGSALFVSRDDVVTARAWQALCAARVAQLGLGEDSEEVTTCSRAWNFRSRTEPPLGAGYCANAASQVNTELS